MIQQTKCLFLSFTNGKATVFIDNWFSVDEIRIIQASAVIASGSILAFTIHSNLIAPTDDDYVAFINQNAIDAETASMNTVRYLFPVPQTIRGQINFYARDFSKVVNNSIVANVVVIVEFINNSLN